MLFSNHDSDGSPFISMMGIQNALRTGNMVADVVIAMCVPVVLKIVFVWVEKFGKLCDLELLLSWFEKKPVMYERFISHVVETGADCSNLDEDSQNAVLHKAVKVYLHQVVQLDLRSAYMDLTKMKEEECNSADDDDDSYEDDLIGSSKTVAGQLSRYKILNGLPYSQWHDIGRYGKAKGLVQLRIKFSNTMDGSDDNNGARNAKSVKNTTFHFISNEKDAIDAFVDSAYKWYLRMLRKMEDNSRFYYEMRVPDITSRRASGHDRQSSSIRYKQYKLSDEKTFESLFFREKESLLALIDHFTAKTGKYGIKGYPHKLGLLLHGPPGTGKTSLIKALAQYTGRSIVNVPLSRVLTNSELMSVFFDRQFRLEDSFYYAVLDFDDVIYVMEDCDAASHVVKKRSGESPTELGTLESITLPNPKSLWRLLLESRSSTCQNVVKMLLKSSERLKEEAEKERPKVLCSIAKRLNEQPALRLINEASDDPLIYRACTDAIESADATKKQQNKLDEILTTHAEAIMILLESGAHVNDEFVDELLGETLSLKCHSSSVAPQVCTNQKPSNASIGFPASEPATIATEESFTASDKEISFGASFFKPNPDALSLSGLLNVLDGVVDTPGRIVILTSNHPELLDPALIRPGRVDKTLKLGYMEATDIVNMLELYYQTTLSSTDVARVTATVEGVNGDGKSNLRMTPAQVEQLTAEHDQLEDMIRLLEEKSPSVPTKTGNLEKELQISSRRI